MPDPQRLTISATESPALFGASPYLTRWMLYRKFAHGDEEEKQPNPRMDWGTKMQPLIISEVSSERCLEVQPNPDTYVRRGLLGCTRDATIISPGVGPGALEIKCVFDYSVWMTKWQGGKVVPREYEIQLQQQMFVGDADPSGVADGGDSYKWGLIAVWVCADMYYFERKPVVDLWDELQRRAIGFFSDVRKKREPDPFGADVEMPLLRRLYPLEPGNTLDLSEYPDHVKTSEKVSMYAYHKAEAVGQKAAEEKIRIELLALAKEAEFVKLPCGVNFRVRRSGRGKTIDPFIPETLSPAPLPREPLLSGG